MARTIEELIVLHRISLRYLIARESKLLSLGKRPVNKKIAKFVENHQSESNIWTCFLDSLNEDLTRNINVFEWKLREEDVVENRPRKYRLDSTSRDFLHHYKMPYGGRMTEAPVVRVEQGELQGRVATSPSGKAFYSFQGIPYAKPPLGSLRFKAPQPPEPWEGIRDATSEGNISAQIDPHTKEYLGDENCLFLNIYTNNLDGSFLPVMLYIHGGGFRFGSGSSSLYGGDYLVEKDVVVVTINYRCGALGFLSLNTPEVPGNAGLKDIVQAIRWVKENIHNFGGNPGNLTVFGESCGGVATSVLTASPLTKNLISKAIIQSGTGLNSWAFQKNPIDNARSLAKTLGCEAEDVDEILDFLSATSVKDIVEANEKMQPEESFYQKGSIVFTVVVEKEFPNTEAVLTEAFIDILTSGRTAEIPVMIGSTALEFTFGNINEDLQSFIPEELHIERNTPESVAIADKIKSLYFKGNHTGVESLNEYFELLSDKLVNIDTHRYVQYLVKVSKKPLYYYKFDYVGELNLSKKMLASLGLKHAAHMDELGYLFRNDLQKDVEPTPQDVRMRERMLRLWTNFAKTGNPTHEETQFINVDWLPVNKDHLYYLNLSEELSLGTNPDKEKMEFWDELYNKHYRIWEHPKTNNDVVRNDVAKNDVVETMVLVTETVVEPVSEPNAGAQTIIIETTIVEAVTTEPEPPKVVESEPEPPKVVDSEPAPTKVVESEPEPPKVVEEPPKVEEPAYDPPKVVETAYEPPKVVEQVYEATKNGDIKAENGFKTTELNGNGAHKARTSNEIKMVQNANGVPKDVIRANDPPEDDLPKNIGVNKFVNFFESLGGKK